ncbi:MAG TPA: mandelate racemase/muconate lactonizing enzyme family protein [Candidatus Sulfopaludibacter sp.]|jgi:L-alanine-DL-glutamate epimerase-like enolase superfamily enzyme|nr:mandelate racemase/muconate lactonizing enzyme family protein [Candidatus Sulfopaludibacter sp.]
MKLSNRTARRSFLKGAGALAAGFWADETLEALPQNTQTNSKPSDLKITDLRIAVVARAPMTCPIIRIDTNEGIYGLGEVRDGASKNYALMLKSKLLGQNPCNVDRLFRRIKQFGNHSRQAGGVCGVEMALWDLAGKAYNVPVYQMIGGKFRDKIRCYADTTESPDPKIFGQRLKARMDEGFTWLKMDLGVDLVGKVPGAVTRPAGVSLGGGDTVPHMFTGIELTEKGAALMSDFVAAVREQVGMDVPLSADHFGHIGVNSCIRLGKALEKHNMAWLEDMIPWQNTELLKKISDAVDIPILTGEDIYLKESFIELCRAHAVDIIHPDLATSGGILETKKIGDAAMELGVPMAMHFAGSPVSCMANVHCAAATENFLVLENHSVDVPWWGDLVNGVEKPIVNKGFITVPDKPGLGVTLNEAVVKQHLLPADNGYFEPTPQWDVDRTNDRWWS